MPVTKPLKAHEQRVVNEREDLDWKLGNLVAFFGTPLFASLETVDNGLLHQQAVVMAEYSRILTARIERF